MQAELPITRTNFFEYSNNPHGFRYITGFSSNSLILSLALGVLDIFARFKSQSLKNYLKMIDHSLQSMFNEAKVNHPQSVKCIEFFSSFVEKIKEISTSKEAFDYLDYYTIANPQMYLNSLELGFRYLLAVIFANKEEYKQMVIWNQDLQPIRKLIFHHFAEKLGLVLDIYDNVEKETFKCSKIGDFPILNLYTWNKDYYMVYTDEMYQERRDPNFSSELKKGPFFLSTNKKNFKPISNPQPEPILQPAQLDYNNTNQVLSEIIIKIADELLKNGSYSEEFSSFIENCMKNNSDVSKINILNKFVKSFPKINADTSIQQDSILLTISSTEFQSDSSTLLKICLVCKRSLSYSYFKSTSHANCEVCINCVHQSPDYCPKCKIQYTYEDKEILRLPS